MPKKQQRNGFYYFMTELQPQLQREGRAFPNGIADVVPVAHPRWKALPAHERDRYEGMAKKAKKDAQRNPNSSKLDNMGKIISERVDPHEAKVKRKSREKKIVRSRWPNNESLMEEKMYFISFEVLCELPADTKKDLQYLPREVGIVEWSMAAGISKIYHEFIDSGGIPLGYRYQCMSHSEETHQIPVGEFELDTNDYMGLWIRMKNFINPGGTKKEYPPMFCLGAQMEKVEDCMTWLYEHSRLRSQEENVLHKIYFLENVVPLFYEIGNMMKREDEEAVPMSMSEGGAIDLLTTSAFDYEKGTRCDWHEEKSCKYCAVATSKRYAYALSDSLANIFDFELTPMHMPTRSSAPAFTIVAAPALDYNYMGKRGNNNPNQSTWRNQESSGSYGARNQENNGPYGARDYREKQKPQQPQEPSLSQGLRRPNAPPLASKTASYVPPVAPWAKTAAPAENSNFAADDFPSLGGAPSTKSQKAGRAQQQQQKTLGQAVQQQQQQPSLSQGLQQQSSLSKAVQQQPSLSQAVQEKQQQERQTLGQAVQQQKQPSVQQQQQQTLSQAVHQQQQPRQTLGQAVQQQSLSQAVQQQSLSQAVQKQQQPTLTQAVRQQQQPPRQTLEQAVQQQQQQFVPAALPASNPWSQGAPSTHLPASNPWSQGAPNIGRGAARADSNMPPTADISQMMSFGRGRGILAGGAARGPAQPGQYPGQAPGFNPGQAPGFSTSQMPGFYPGQPGAAGDINKDVAPPPGLGRGLTIQMEDMHLGRGGGQHH